MLLCGLLWVICGPLWVLCGSFAVFSHTAIASDSAIGNRWQFDTIAGGDVEESAALVNLHITNPK